MTVIMTRLDATVALGGATVTGAGGDADLATRDDDDATKVTVEFGDVLRLGFAEPTIPAGALVKQIAARVRIGSATGPSARVVRIKLFAPSEIGSVDTTVTWSTATTIEALLAAIDDAPTGVEIELSSIAGSGTGVFVYELYVVTTCVEQPVTVVALPTGTVDETNRPVAVWGVSPLDADGGLPTHYEAKLFNDAQYGAGGFDEDTSTPVAESGIIAGTSTPGVWQPDDGVPNDTYRVYARTAQTVNGEQFWSDWDFTGFVVDVDVPADPTLTLTGQDSGGRILVEIEDGGGGDATTDLFEVQRSDDGGTTWVNVRTEDGGGRLAEVGGEASVYDYESGNGATTFFRARAVHSFSGSESYSAWVQDSATWSSRSWWIKHPAMPGLNYEAVWGRLTSYPGHQRSGRQGVHHPAGRTFPIVVTDTRGPRTGTLVVRADSDEEREAFDALMVYTLPMLVQGPADEHEPDRWVSFGDLERQRVADKSWIEPTNETLAWVEVARPTDEQMIETFGAGLFPSDDLYPAL